MLEPRPTPFDDLDGFAVLRAQDVADRLGVGARSVRRAIARGELAASRACGLRILAADAAAWWRASSVTPTVCSPETPTARRHANGAEIAPLPGGRRPGRSSTRLPLPTRGSGR
jgi:hypothetical protein